MLFMSFPQLHVSRLDALPGSVYVHILVRASSPSYTLFSPCIGLFSGLGSFHIYMKHPIFVPFRLARRHPNLYFLCISSDACCTRVMGTLEFTL
jgi:hypothetical protein